MYDHNSTRENNAAGNASIDSGYDEPGETNDTLLTIHDGYDVRNGQSRLHSYLARNRNLFSAITDGGTTDRNEFAAAVFQIASPPIMSPPYIGTHPRVRRAYPRRDDRHHHALIVEIAIPTSERIRDHLPRPNRGWVHDHRPDMYHPPLDYDEPIAYVHLTLGMPMPADLLPEPAYDDHAVPHIDVAKRALRAVTTHASALCAQLLGDLNAAPHQL